MTKRRDFLMVVGLTVLCSAFLAAQTKTIPMRVNRDVFEFVGQVNNTPTGSQQFGYISGILGLSGVFVDGQQNESTALFTFVANATTDRVITNGPLKIVNRSGTTTIYLNTPPSDFANPDSFSQGTPIQVSSYTQQVVINTLTNTFTTLHINNVTEVDGFTLNGCTYKLGRVGQTFRTTYTGAVNSNGAPSGWYGGHAVGSGPN